MAIRVGLISDTHGLLRPEAVDAIRDVETIVHAGDVGDPHILSTLRALAPVVAVRGNVDHGDWADALPESQTVQIGGLLIHVVHDRAKLAIDPVAERIAVVVYGHSHRPLSEPSDGVLFVNPGSAGPRRFTLPITVAILTIDGARPEVEIVPLDLGKSGEEGK